jgi:FkbM family methyltransferase
MKVIKIIHRMFYNSKLKNLKFVTTIYEQLFHSVFSKSELINVTSFGAQIQIPGKDITILPSLLNNTFEKELLSFLVGYLNVGMVFVDVGANIGIHSSIAARCVGDSGKIIAFEPVPENYDLLILNLNKNIDEASENVFCAEQVAISDQVGDATIYLDENSIGTHSMTQAKSGAKKNIQIKTTTLDHYFENSNFKIDVLKIDIEGHELAALTGAVKTINITDLIFIEFDANHFDNESKIKKLLELTREHPFLYFFDEGRGKIKKINSQELYGLKLCNNLLFSKFEINVSLLRS